ncbi:WXG100 family type VII secretion target [Paenibacillus polymyxa]|uniref:WXG100 family type VII secretion target n=1 Tax=Paenibacillus polymyxa TaxID=1406 RepID=UPI000675DD0E|nr:WXG100 family type VII secretion target [Paenibacillus polymyxa]MBY7736396.1 WXG100 family type VII secretion target [Paenibacillus polymyxa]
MTTIKVTPEQLMTVSKQFELAQQTATQMNSNLVQQILSMGQLWEGITKEHFYYSFQTSQKNMNDFVTLTDSISKELRHHADKFKLADLMEAGNIDASCLPPPPNSCAVLAPDTRNAFQKSVDSLTELGQDFVDANSVRYEKKFDSVWSFLDYMSYGIPKGMYQGYMERAAKQNDSWNDMLNFGTFGVTGMIQGAFNPNNAWSKEHWANIIGTAGLFGGVSSVIKPKIGIGSTIKLNGEVRPFPKGHDLDLKSWEEMPVSGQRKVTPTGHRIMNVSEMKSFKKEMDALEIKVLIDKKDKILPESAAAGFNPATGEIVLRKEPTNLSAIHESYHAKQWKELGKDNYLQQSTLEREEFVYNEIMKNKELFNDGEILFSQKYIYKLRNGDWPPPGWKGFENNE